MHNGNYASVFITFRNGTIGSIFSLFRFFVDLAAFFFNHFITTVADCENISIGDAKGNDMCQNTYIFV